MVHRGSHRNHCVCALLARSNISAVTTTDPSTSTSYSSSNESSTEDTTYTYNGDEVARLTTLNENNPYLQSTCSTSAGISSYVFPFNGELSYAQMVAMSAVSACEYYFRAVLLVQLQECVDANVYIRTTAETVLQLANTSGTAPTEAEVNAAIAVRRTYNLALRDGDGSASGEKSRRPRKSFIAAVLAVRLVARRGAVASACRPPPPPAKRPQTVRDFASVGRRGFAYHEGAYKFLMTRCDANDVVAQTPAETRKPPGGRDVPDFIPAPPAKKRKRRDDMPRVWLRLELFELGLLPLPSKHAATLTVGNVKKALDALHNKLPAVGADDAAGDDAVMTDVEGSFVESDNLNSVTFAVWKEAVDAIFQWREQDYKAFWLLLVQFHRMIPVKNAVPTDTTTPLDVQQCLEREEVPVFKMAIFLFIQTVKPHSWRTKYSLDSFNAVWYREHAESLAVAAALETAGALAAATAPKSPVLNALGSPHMRGAASPPPPQSPHTVGMADRSTADAYYLSFVREKLEDLFGLLYPSVDLKDESQTVVSADQIDLLGFLLCLGDSSLADKNVRLSSCYPKWELPGGGDAMAEADGAQEFVQRVENGAKVCRFYKTHLSLNEKMYPPVGFSVPATGAQNNLSSPSPPAFSLNDDFSLDGSAEMAPPQEETVGRPIILSQLVKTTVIKRATEVAASSDNGQLLDVIIFSCQDSYVYILGPVRTNVTISACKNCRIVTAPNTGILSMERCENVQLTSLSGLVRVSNCLDTRLNVYTLSPIIVSGENVGVILGPYNTKYSGLKQQLSTVPFLFNPESQGSWNLYLDLDSEKDITETDKPPISLQVPETFRDVCVPVKPAAGSGPAERPFPIPPEYVAAVRKQYETVEALRQLVTSDEFDLTKKRTMEVVIQLKFKEWLSSTSNVRQILDLVHLDRVNGGCEPASKES